MSNDIEFEWIEPTQEHVGQVIEVRDDESKAWKPAKLTGILADEYKFAAKTDEYGSLSWKYGRSIRSVFALNERMSATTCGCIEIKKLSLLGSHGKLAFDTSVKG